MTIGQTGVGTQVTDSFVTMAYAMLVGIGLVYLLLVSLVIFFALALVVIGSFVALAVIGHATNIIIGLTVSLHAVALPVTVIAAGMWITYSVGGLYGVALAVAAMPPMVTIVVAVDSYGTIVDNADGIAELSERPHEVRTITDVLDAVGNTTKAVTKSYAIGSATTTTSMGHWPTEMVCSTLPVLSSRMLTASLPELAMKTWPLTSSTSAILRAVPPTTVSPVASPTVSPLEPEPCRGMPTVHEITCMVHEITCIRTGSVRVLPASRVCAVQPLTSMMLHRPRQVKAEGERELVRNLPVEGAHADLLVERVDAGCLGP